MNTDYLIYSAVDKKPQNFFHLLIAMASMFKINWNIIADVAVLRDRLSFRISGNCYEIMHINNYVQIDIYQWLYPKTRKTYYVSNEFSLLVCLSELFKFSTGIEPDKNDDGTFYIYAMNNANDRHLIHSLPQMITMLWCS